MAAIPNAADVGIVGAGPAGCAAAWSLARRGARVVILDHTHPREKPCGGGVTARALGLIAEALDGSGFAGLAIHDVVFEDGGAPPARVALHAPDRRAARRDDAALFVVDRRSFDARLLDAAVAAGATHVAERVLDVDATGAGAALVTRQGSCRVRWAIGADGANSLVRRRVARPFSREQLSVARGVFAHGVTSDEILIRFVASPAGYLWSFPRRDHLAIGICAPAGGTCALDLRRALERWLKEKNLTAGATLVHYGWPIPSLGPGDLARERPAGEGWLLAGDAAGLVDPITREGIFFALQSGLFAADAIATDRDVAAGYAGRLRDEIFPELARAGRLRRGFFRGAFTRLLVEALSQSAAVRSVMADLVAGRQSYASLKRRLMATMNVGLAWRLLMLELGRG